MWVYVSIYERGYINICTLLQILSVGHTTLELNSVSQNVCMKVYFTVCVGERERERCLYPYRRVERGVGGGAIKG